MRALLALTAACLALLVVTEAVGFQFQQFQYQQRQYQRQEPLSLVSSAPKPCCGPDVMEAELYGFAGVYLVTGSIHIDTKAQQAAQNTTLWSQSEQHNARTVLRDGFVYTITAKSCTRKPFKEKITNCPIQNNQFVQSFTLGGLGGMYIKINEWASQGGSSFVTADKCGITFQASAPNAIGYFNSTLSIKDRGVFKLPDNCPKAAEIAEEESDYDMMQQLLAIHQGLQRFFH